jgi:hypothetical protein
MDAGCGPQARIFPAARIKIIKKDAINGTLVMPYTATHARAETTAAAGLT